MGLLVALVGDYEWRLQRMGEYIKATPDDARRTCNASTYRILCFDSYPYNEVVIRIRTKSFRSNYPDTLTTMKVISHSGQKNFSPAPHSKGAVCRSWNN